MSYKVSELFVSTSNQRISHTWTSQISSLWNIYRHLFLLLWYIRGLLALFGNSAAMVMGGRGSLWFKLLVLRLAGHVEVKEPGDDEGKHQTGEQEFEETMSLPEALCLQCRCGRWCRRAGLCRLICGFSLAHTVDISCCGATYLAGPLMRDTEKEVAGS